MSLEVKGVAENEDGKCLLAFKSVKRSFSYPV